MEPPLSQPPQKITHRRTTFTNAQRLQICNQREQNPGMSQNELATWACEAFNLPRKPSQAMISNILKRKRDLESMTNDQLISKVRRSVRYPQLDTALARWVCYCEEVGIPVTGEAIRLKAATFSKLLHIDAPLRFSNGWLYKFNERHGFGCMKAHKVKRMSANQMIAELQRRLCTYDPRNVFTMDETGLLFTMFPDRSGKRTTKRLTIALCCNADGSEKLPLLFIGKSEKPRGFTNSTAVEMNYLHNTDTLMTREIFIKWINDVNALFYRQQRRCVLLIDSAIVHAGFNPVELQNVEVMVLPPGSPSTFHPMTAGIIAAFKRRYRQRQIQFVLDHLDADADVSTFAKFDSVGVRQALSWCIDSWDAIPPSVIISSWQETGLLYANPSGYECRNDEAALSEELAVMLSWLHAVNPLTVEELLNLPEENVTMDEPSDEDFCAPMEAVKLFSRPARSEPVNTDGTLSVEEIKEHLKWIAKLLIYATETNIPSDSLTGMRMLQRCFRDQLAKKQKCSS